MVNETTIGDRKMDQASTVTAEKLSAKTYTNIVGVLKVCLDWVVSQRLLGTNPMPKQRMRARIERASAVRYLCACSLFFCFRWSRGRY